MTQKEQELAELIENLTKQIELSNKIAMKQMQQSNTPSLNEERLAEAEIGLMNKKEHFYKNAADLLGIISTITVIISILIIITFLIHNLISCTSGSLNVFLDILFRKESIFFSIFFYLF